MEAAHRILSSFIKFSVVLIGTEIVERQGSLGDQGHNLVSREKTPQCALSSHSTGCPCEAWDDAQLKEATSFVLPLPCHSDPATLEWPCNRRSYLSHVQWGTLAG